MSEDIIISYGFGFAISGFITAISILFLAILFGNREATTGELVVICIVIAVLTFIIGTVLLNLKRGRSLRDDKM